MRFLWLFLPRCLLLLSAVVIGISQTQQLHHQQHNHARQSHVYGVSAVYNLLTRVLPNTTIHQLEQQLHLGLLETHDSDKLFFRLQDGFDSNHKTVVSIQATSVSELTAGVGYYLRQYCNVTVGWPRGGGSRLVLPSVWPSIGSDQVVERRRIVRWSYLMNVCTHSYSLVWYDWPQWEAFIDWMALSGVNMMLALTGQEEIQYQVFRRLGLPDDEIRSWFNGPAFLTWSRGQNEYGSNIAGPLPRSWMKAQWKLQRNQILPRLRSLGIVGQLPGFQGNVPVGLKALLQDDNITSAGATGWMDALDPWYGKIADLWMHQLLEDFGTDHWYQLDGYFNGGTAPWVSSTGGTAPSESKTNEDYDETWFRRGKEVYNGLIRTDPKAIWSYQGFAFVGWDDTPDNARRANGLIRSVPQGRFVVIDMSYEDGEWRKWNNASFFGAPFIWTALHDFGGTDGIKGNVKRWNQVPFEAIDEGASVSGSGGTPEGIDQNPAFYEFVCEQNFRTEPVGDLAEHFVERSHRRYGLQKRNWKVARAWTLLVNSIHSIERSVQDSTAIAHLDPSESASLFLEDRTSPNPVLCDVFEAWELMIDAANATSFEKSSIPDTMAYDLINLGREVLAQLSIPVALNFSDAINSERMERDELRRTASLYSELLGDVDELVGTNSAFLLGPWLETARQWGSGTMGDCYSPTLGNNQEGDESCMNFYEWNARCQLTTWNPTPRDSPAIPGGPIDYAAKHWNGLIRDYYGKRLHLIWSQASLDLAAGRSLNQTAVSRLLATHAYNWTTSTNKYDTKPSGNAIDVSYQMHMKYKKYFQLCFNVVTTSWTAAYR